MPVEELLCQACGRLWDRPMAHGQSVPDLCADCHNAATSNREVATAAHPSVTEPGWDDLPRVRHIFLLPPDWLPVPGTAPPAPEFVDCPQCGGTWLANEDQRVCPVCKKRAFPGGLDPDDPAAWRAVTCIVCRGVVLDLVAAPAEHPLCPRCDTGPNHEGRGKHGLGRALKHDCRCKTCLVALAKAWDYVDRRVAGETLEDIGASVEPKPLTRESVRQITAKVAPRAPWEAAHEKAKAEAAVVESMRASTLAAMNAARSCRTCGGGLPATANSLQKFCCAACRKACDSLRYTIDENRREMQRLRSAQWRLENPEGASSEALRYARKVVAGTHREYKGRRWMIEGSSSWKNAVEAMVKGWPIADELPGPIRRQIAEHLGWDLSDFPAPPPDEWGQHAAGKGPYADVLTAEFLERAYTDEGRSASDIADEVGCTHQTVLTALRRRGVSTRSGALVTYGEILTRKFLEEEYVDAGKGAPQIADEVGCNRSTVYAALERHGIPRRGSEDLGTWTQVLSESLLRAEYVEAGKSIRQIADEIGCSPHTVVAALDRHELRQPASGGNNGYRDWTHVLTRDFLLDEYVGRGMSAPAIASQIGCHRSIVYAALDRHGIERHSGGSGRASWEDVLTEQYLRAEYVERGKSGTQIASETGANPSVVYAWLERHGIPRREEREGRDWQEDWLRHQYLVRGRSGSDIAEELGVPAPTLYTALRRFGIRRDV